MVGRLHVAKRVELCRMKSVGDDCGKAMERQAKEKMEGQYQGRHGDTGSGGGGYPRQSHMETAYLHWQPHMSGIKACSRRRRRKRKRRRRRRSLHSMLLINYICDKKNTDSSLSSMACRCLLNVFNWQIFVK